MDVITLKPAIQKKKLGLIQSFRGAAVIFVLLFHVDLLSTKFLNTSLLFGLFDIGYSGVDFFFILSGFIIFYIHQGDIGNRAKFKPFIVKRFIRIYPIYLLVTLIILPLYLSGYGEPYKRDIIVIIKSLLLYPFQVNNDGTHETTPLLLVGWTLSFEVLFYMLFSLSMLIKKRWHSLIYITWIIAIFILFIAELTNTFRFDEKSTLLRFIFNSRNLEFVAGCTIAYLVKEYNLVKQAKYFIIMGIAIILFVGINYSPELIKTPAGLVIIYGIPYSFIILGAASIDVYKPVKIPQIFNYLGDASYSIYLTHYIIINVLLLIAAKLQLVNSFIGYVLLVLSVTIGVSLMGCYFFKYIEKPLLTWLKGLFSKITQV